MTVLRYFLSLFIKIYQTCISPYTPPSCRFYPSCSQYAHDAINTLPIMIALWRILFRLLRCHPFSAGGYDPVHK